MRKINYALLAGALALACTSCNQAEQEASYQVIPLPQEATPYRNATPNFCRNTSGNPRVTRRRPKPSRPVSG